MTRPANAGTLFVAGGPGPPASLPRAAALAHELFSAMQANGWGDLDHPAVIKVIEMLSDVEARTGERQAGLDRFGQKAMACCTGPPRDGDWSVLCREPGDLPGARREAWKAAGIFPSGWGV